MSVKNVASLMNRKSGRRNVRTGVHNTKVVTWRLSNTASHQNELVTLFS